MAWKQNWLLPRADLHKITKRFDYWAEEALRTDLYVGNFAARKAAKLAGIVPHEDHRHVKELLEKVIAHLVEQPLDDPDTVDALVETCVRFDSLDDVDLPD